jgi:hypothetical protein
MADMNEDPFLEPVFSKKVLEMLTVANEYCLYIEKAEDYPREDILEYLQKLLPLLYLKASLLPDIEVEDDSAAEHFVTEEQWENLFNTLRQKFGKEDLYYIIDRSDLSEIKAIQASLSENLADIYQDMKDFILLYQKPLKISKENAVRDCRDLFISRTGSRIVDAHQDIHYLLYGNSTDHEDPLDLSN